MELRVLSRNAAAKDINKRVPTAVSKLTSSQRIPVQSISKLSVLFDGFERFVGSVEVPDSTINLIKHNAIEFRYVEANLV